VFIGAAESLQQVGRYHQNWIQAIGTRDQLDREREMFLARANAYAPPKEVTSTEQERRIALFADRVAILSAAEQGEWRQLRESVKQEVGTHVESRDPDRRNVTPIKRDDAKPEDQPPQKRHGASEGQNEAANDVAANGGKEKPPGGGQV
jgi:hypothetical protein